MTAWWFAALPLFVAGVAIWLFLASEHDDGGD